MIKFNPIHELFSVGFFHVYSWGFMFVVAFIVALILTLREAKKQKIDAKHVYNVALLFLVGAIVGARLFYVLEHFSYFIEKPIEIIIGQGGLTSYGAFLGVLFIWLYARKQKDITFLQLLDLIAPYAFLAIAITRIGCFLNWDDFGKQSSLPWAIKVDDFARHPTQLYESFYSLISFFILQGFKKIREKQKDKTKFKKFLIKKFLRRLEKPGALFFLFLLFYSFFRFFNDFLREYETHFLGLALSQWLCLAIFFFSISRFSFSQNDSDGMC